MDDSPENFDIMPSSMSIDAISLSSVGAHLIFTDINEMSAQRAVEFLLKTNIILQDKFPLTLFLNTPGGDCTAGYAIINVMEMSRLPISTVGLGEVASMGVSILASGTKGMRFVTKNTMIMSHQYSAGNGGKYHELIASRVMQDRLQETFVQHFKRTTTMTVKQINDILMGPSDRYLTPQECVGYGIIDFVKSPWQLEDEMAEVVQKVTAKKKKTKSVSKG